MVSAVEKRIFKNTLSYFSSNEVKNLTNLLPKCNDDIVSISETYSEMTILKESAYITLSLQDTQHDAITISK